MIIPSKRDGEGMPDSTKSIAKKPQEERRGEEGSPISTSYIHLLGICIYCNRIGGMEEEKDESGRMKFRCIHCGCKIKLLFIQYSPGNIRLMKCGNCKVVADEYIECEIMIILIDLVMHKTKAYRHLLLNAPTLHPVDFRGVLWKSAILYLLLDGYKNFLLKEDSSLSLNTISSSLICVKMLIDVLLVNFVFFCVLFLVATRILQTASATRYIDIYLAIFASSYMRIFLVAMMVWDFPSSVLYIIDMFVLSSNAVALKVVTESKMSRCIWAFAFSASLLLLREALQHLNVSSFWVFPLSLEKEIDDLSSCGYVDVLKLSKKRIKPLFCLKQLYIPTQKVSTSINLNVTTILILDLVIISSTILVVKSVSTE
ncbi:hypothetical protein MKW98_013310 [Papaver atlanticum]|uniref:Protein ARV n=1 Tax=Papaver atlanticum TaxID=357466 RepID=A0AAD4SSJ0_9MAGN|nr:hypothetical protein MKW98_013310 [Papaver atlanticum]